MRKRNQNKKNRNAMGRVFVSVFVIVLAVQWLRGEHKIVITNDQPWNPVAEASEAITPDPCDLEDVVCEDERPETIEGKIHRALPEDPTNAVKVFACESGLDPKKHSGVDVMADGRAFSVGLTQINLTVSRIGGLECNKAFVGRNFAARVVDEQLYSRCVEAAEDIDNSLEAARKKFIGGNGWGAWMNCAKNVGAKI